MRLFQLLLIICPYWSVILDYKYEIGSIFSLVGLGEENCFRAFWLADFVCNRFMGPVFKGLVVGIFTDNTNPSIKNALFVVHELGL